MAEPQKKKTEEELKELRKQPLALRELLGAFSTARRQSSLYGADHPNTRKCAEEIEKALVEFLANFDHATFVFGRNAVIINDQYYVASPESQEIAQRLRARGAMAITFAGSVPAEQIINFLGFMNTDPKEIRVQGGPSQYLRTHSVSRIVATDAVYVSGDESEYEDGDISSRADWNADNIGHAIEAAIHWLSNQDEPEDEADKLPISDILSHPDQAAKLIREAVTKLHVSRREETVGEVASEVVHDLKDLARTNKEKWDESTPQIRKALSKLPRDMRPEIAGFTEEELEANDLSGPKSDKVADVSEIEKKFTEVFNDSIHTPRMLPRPDDFEPLFGAKADGLLSSWRRELQPDSVIGSSGKTLETLMTWEDGSVEHGRIALAMAALIPRALEMKDIPSACIIAQSLVREMRRDDMLNWHSANAKAALQNIDLSQLGALVDGALDLGDSEARNVACTLVETVPNLALSKFNLLGSSGSAIFNESLKKGIAAAGQAAIGPLGALLRGGTGSSREFALEILIRMSGTAAVKEIASVIREANETDSTFTVKALHLLPAVRIPMVTEICIECLSHSSAEVRCAALGALGEMGHESAVPHIIRFAQRRSLAQDDMAEKIAAINALGRIECPETVSCLTKMASYKPLIGRSRYEPIRIAAERVLDDIRSRQSQLKAA